MSGHNWNDFVRSNEKLFSSNRLVTAARGVTERLLRRDTCRLSRERIERLTREPRFAPPAKTFKLSRKDKVFAMGSCFARHLREVLEQTGFDVYPKFKTLRFDPSIVSVASLPKKNSLIWYDSFTIRQEFDKAFGVLAHDPDDVWTIEASEYFWADRYPQFSGKTVYSDPYRRHVFSTNKGALNETRIGMDRLIKEGIETCDVFFMTLGVTEVWRKRDSGLMCCARPNFFDFGDRCELVLSGYEENYSNLRSVVANVNRSFPGRRIVLTVSPVPLARTFSGNDIYVATQECKAILRAAVQKLAREVENVYYFPGFELFQLMHISARNKAELFNTGGRNLSARAIERVMAYFFGLYSVLDEWGTESIEFGVTPGE